MKILYPGLLFLWMGLQGLYAQDAGRFDAYIPEGYRQVEETIQGDLNGDDRKDYILLIQNTDKRAFVKNRFGDTVNRNRRGLIILFGQKDGYSEVFKSLECFSSAQEDGGVYFPPELWVSINGSKIIITYAHGRYGYWAYTFRYQQGAFYLIGYDESDDYGPIIDTQISINYLTKKKLVRKNTNPDTQESGAEVFKETWSDISMKSLTPLASIADFDNFEAPGIL